MSIYKDSIVKLKEDVPDGDKYGLDKDTQYLVLDHSYARSATGHQDMLVIRNKKGKKRKYYERLFDEVKFDQTRIPEEYKLDYDKWLNLGNKYTKQEEKDARERIYIIREEYNSGLPKKGTRIKFVNGPLSVKYKDRVFEIKMIKPNGLLDAIVKLKGLKESYRFNEMEVVDGI